MILIDKIADLVAHAAHLDATHKFRSADAIDRYLLRCAESDLGSTQLSDTDTADISPVKPVTDFSADGLSPDYFQKNMSSLRDVTHLFDNDLPYLSPNSDHHMWVYPGGKIVHLPDQHVQMIEKMRRKMIADHIADNSEDAQLPNPSRERLLTEKPTYSFFMAGSGGSIRVYVARDSNTLNATVMGIPTEAQLQSLEKLKSALNKKYAYIDYLTQSGHHVAELGGIQRLRDFLKQHSDPQTPPKPSSPLLPFLHDERLWRMSHTTK